MKSVVHLTEQEAVPALKQIAGLRKARVANHGEKMFNFFCYRYPTLLSPKVTLLQINFFSRQCVFISFI